MSNLLRETAVLCLSEDQASTRGGLAADLRAAGATVETQPITAPLDLAHVAYRLVLIDAAASDERYFSACARLRSATRLPIMLVLRGSAREQALRGFAAGADACLLAPYDPLELEARAAALVRRELGRPRANASALSVV